MHSWVVTSQDTQDGDLKPDMKPQPHFRCASRLHTASYKYAPSQVTGPTVQYVGVATDRRSPLAICMPFGPPHYKPLSLTLFLKIWSEIENKLWNEVLYPSVSDQTWKFLFQSDLSPRLIAMLDIMIWYDGQCRSILGGDLSWAVDSVMGCVVWCGKRAVVLPSKRRLIFFFGFICSETRTGYPKLY